MYCNPILIGMDAGQVAGCLLVAAFFMAVVIGVNEKFEKSSFRNRMIAVYLVGVIGVAIIFALGLSIGRQGCF